MSIWINKDTRVMVQGITGHAGSYHTKQMLDYGTNIVAGVSPNKDQREVEGVLVFDSVQSAKQATGANVSVIYVPAPYAKDAIIEAVDADLDWVVCITEHIPIADMIQVKAYMKDKRSRLLGPNCPGMISPGQSKIGIMPGHIHKKGHVGIVSKSGTLTYEAVQVVTACGFGQSTAVGIGGDPIQGTSFIDVLKAFEEDPQTKMVILIGEIGGDAEEKAALWIKEHMSKPVIGFISGQTAPKGKTMGHAGAIVSGNQGSAASKIKALKNAGVSVAASMTEMESLLKELHA
jgi:succinyl-CoA synthetase alpha subunit